MRKRIGLAFLFIFLLTLSVNARTDWDTEDNFYNPSDCPITIIKIESHWQNYRPPVYNQYGWCLKRRLLPGIWCKTHYELPDEKDGGREILAVKFGIWYFNAFDELLGAYTAYTTENKIKPGKEYTAEWLTNDEKLGSTHYRTIIYPFEIRFSDKQWWIADSEEIYKWFVDTMDLTDAPEYEDMFPEDEFGNEEQWEKKLKQA